jgi:hypothetical protein
MAFSRRHMPSSISLTQILCLLVVSTAPAAQTLIAHPGIGLSELSVNEARLYVTMRHKTWPNGQPVKVFVLADDAPLHRDVTKTVLGMYPYQLRRIWDRQLFSGTGQAPTVVANEAQMLQRVATTPGAIGYVEALSTGAPVRRVEVK